MRAYFHGLAGFEKVIDLPENSKSIYYFDTIGSVYPYFIEDENKVSFKSANKKLRFEHIGSMPVYKFIGIE